MYQIGVARCKLPATQRVSEPFEAPLCLPHIWHVCMGFCNKMLKKIGGKPPCEVSLHSKKNVCVVICGDNWRWSSVSHDSCMIAVWIPEKADHPKFSLKALQKKDIFFKQIMFHICSLSADRIRYRVSILRQALLSNRMKEAAFTRVSFVLLCILLKALFLACRPTEGVEVPARRQRWRTFYLGPRSTSATLSSHSPSPLPPEWTHKLRWMVLKERKKTFKNSKELREVKEVKEAKGVA